MATVKIDQFGGIRPRVHPSLLADGMSVVANNVRFKSGKLVPIRRPSYMSPNSHTLYCENGMGGIAEAKSLFCWKHELKDGTSRTDFLAFPGVVTFARGVGTTDEYDRIYIAGETGIDFTDERGFVYRDTPCVYLFDRESGSIDRRSIVKTTPETLRCSMEDDDVDPDNCTYGTFSISWTDKYGIESPLSLPSMNRNKDQSGYSEDPLRMPGSGGKVVFQPISVNRDAVSMTLYMDIGNGFQKVREYSSYELNSFVKGFSLNLEGVTPGRTADSSENAPFDMRNITYVPGSFYAATSPSSPHAVLFSSRDHAEWWPVANRYEVKDNVVALAVTANSVFVLTDGTPYVMSGTGPSAMTTASLANAAACVSERGVCVYRNMVFFASNYGLFSVADSATSSSTCTCVTDGYFTKDQWSALNPKSCVIGAYDGALHLFFTAPNGGTYPSDTPAFMAGRKHVGIIVDLTESPFAITTHDEVATCLCTDDTTDDLYFVRNTEGV